MPGSHSLRSYAPMCAHAHARRRTRARAHIY
nr:MAG TPA: hypothetical protein [Microviridae sp.]